VETGDTNEVGFGPNAKPMRQRGTASGLRWSAVRAADTRVLVDASDCCAVGCVLRYVPSGIAENRRALRRRDAARQFAEEVFPCVELRGELG